ncbi:MAG: M56 family metallopeptidase [Salinivirgaceae bacterium]|nr:M56 family metallopeptidase [Salinivirgaceae bacterium]
MDAIVYSLKVSVFLIAFYLMFKSLMSRETLHRANRYLILGSIGLSFVLPLWHITLNAAPGHAVTAAELSQSVVWLEEVIVGGGASHSFDWRALAVVAFYAGIGVCLLRMIISIIGVLRVIRRGERQTLPDGTVLVITDDEQAPFSWIKYIIINRKDHDENLQEILTHERAHIRCRHSIDVLVCDVFCCLQWFNPAMWLLRRELCAVHEYEADKAVLDSGINAKQYQILLIKKAAGGKWYSIANSFNHSKLKYRITMMSRKKSSGWTMAKALYVLPIAAFAAIAFANCSKTESENTQDFTYDKNVLQYLPKDRSVKFVGYNLDGTECVLVKEADGKVRRLSADEMGVKGISIPLENREIPEDEIFIIVEDMPEFPGGEEELRKFIAENVEYPEDAKAQKQEGKVFVKFVIDKEGNVRDAEIVNGTRFESLNNEALRVIKSMPQWKPGKQRGQNVNVSFVVPINFQLN